MCTRVTCEECGKPDWRGCGAHVEQALRGVPQGQRCRCREDGTRQKPRTIFQTFFDRSRRR